jgi:hypothetical protein
MSARALRRVKALLAGYEKHGPRWVRRRTTSIRDLYALVALAERAVELALQLAALVREAPHRVSCPQWGGGKGPCDCYAALSPPRAGKSVAERLNSENKQWARVRCSG